MKQDVLDGLVDRLGEDGRNVFESLLSIARENQQARIRHQGILFGMHSTSLYCGNGGCLRSVICGCYGWYENVRDWCAVWYVVLSARSTRIKMRFHWLPITNNHLVGGYQVTIGNG